MAQMTKVATLEELRKSGRLSVIIDDYPALLLLVDDQVCAIEDTCSHDMQPLDDAKLEGKEIICPRHGARFDVTTGKALCLPATSPIQTFAVELRDGDIFAGPADNGADSASHSQIPGSAASSGTEESNVPAESDLAESAAGTDAPVGDSELIDALKQVIDPELMINIVDLGLVYDVQQHDDGQVKVDMTLTSPACPAGPQIVQQAKMALERLEGVDSAEIRLTMTPPWTPERMTDDARDHLGIF